MILHGCCYLFFIRSRRQVKQSVESKQLKVVMVDATKILRTRTLVPVGATIGNTLCAPRGNMTGGNRRRCRGNIKNKPVDPGIWCSVPIFDNKNKTSGPWGDLAELERGTYIFSVAGMGSGNVGVILKSRAGNKHGKLLSYLNGRYMVVVDGTSFPVVWIPPHRARGGCQAKS